ncbi:unnamed protein product [Rotaria magnacalcarata]|uniref:Glycosyl hydrolase family 13 catalytic domain-containing protein n=1 Tax=Rotaria magnacalcarata TaxID=392030 RepID=A0A816YVI6_9BILA|nr:unnamed protein product [Rotaria magnacalcarata]
MSAKLLKNLCSCQTSEPRRDKLIIYEILVRLFGNQNLTNTIHGTIEQNGVGKMNDINDLALKELKRFGYTHVWYCGLLEHATITDYTVYGIRKDNPYIVKGLAGSPYAIKDYYDIDPDIAVDIPNRMSEFEKLIQRTHAHGLQVIMDFIPNHVAREYGSDVRPEEDLGINDDRTKSFSPTNDFYYIENEDFQMHNVEHIPPCIDISKVPKYTEKPARATGNDVFHSRPSMTDWFETIKLNYGIDNATGKNYFDPRPPLWDKIFRILSYWIDKGIDGFRCDMAEMVPVEFWHWLIVTIRQAYPDRRIVFIAEIYRSDLYHRYVEYGLFDYLYDKIGLYDCLRRLLGEESVLGNCNDITRIHNELNYIDRHMVRFLENHDEVRIAAKQFTGNPWKSIPAAVCTATMHSGPFMIYFGQEIGVDSVGPKGFQGDDGRTTIFDYWGIPEYQAWHNKGACDGGQLTTSQKALRSFYETLIKLIHDYKALHCVSSKLIDLQFANHSLYDTRKIYSFIRYHDRDEQLLFILNFDYKNSYDIELAIPNEIWSVLGLDTTKLYTLQEVFIDRTLKLELRANEHIRLSLPGNQVYVLQVQK